MKNIALKIAKTFLGKKSISRSFYYAIFCDQKLEISCLSILIMSATQYNKVPHEHDRYFILRFGLANAISNHLRLKIHVVCGRNF